MAYIIVQNLLVCICYPIFDEEYMSYNNLMIVLPTPKFVMLLIRLIGSNFIPQHIRPFVMVRMRPQFGDGLLGEHLFLLLMHHIIRQRLMDMRTFTILFFLDQQIYPNSQVTIYCNQYQLMFLDSIYQQISLLQGI